MRAIFDTRGECKANQLSPKIMKRSIFAICILFSIFACYGKDMEKQYRKLIEKYDIDQAVKVIDRDNASTFWDIMLKNNELRFKFIEDIEKNKGAEKETIEKTSQLPRFYPNEEEVIVDSLQGFCDTLLMDIGIKQLNLNCSLHIVEDPEPNAFTALTEDGFAMCINTGLLNMKGVKYKTLMGCVAHEFSHGILLHHARKIYADAKQRRKNELIGGVVTGLSVLALGVSAYNGVAAGIPTTSATDFFGLNLNINESFDHLTVKYSFRYSREQEYEADLIAYRFMEYLGASDEYIDALSMLSTEQDKIYNDYSDHPTTSDRISFLKYVQAHPELGNKENDKLRKKIALKMAQENQIRLRRENESWEK